MRNLLLYAAVLSLAAAPAAWAEPHHGGGGHDGGGGHHGGGGHPNGGGHHGGGGGHNFGGGHHVGGGGRFGHHANNVTHRIQTVRQRSFNRGVRTGARVENHEVRGDFRPASGFRGGPGFARRGGGFAYTGSRGSGFGPHGAGRFAYRGHDFNRFRVNPFNYPAGWGYRSWGVGAFLPGLFLTDAYFIGNFGGYDLGPPAPGARWVRYGPDALLVDVNTGRVIDVVHGVFWW